MSLENQLARTIYNGFNAMYADFQNVTLGAKVRFQTDNWQAVNQAQRDRLDIYANKILHVQQLLTDLAGRRIQQLSFWHGIRGEYVSLIQSQLNFEVAESFYNSVYGHFFHFKGDADAPFFFKSDAEDTANWPECYRHKTLAHTDAIANAFEEILNSYQFEAPFTDVSRDSKLIADKLSMLMDANQHMQLQISESVFYRNKGAYLVGFIGVSKKGANIQDTLHPLVIALVKDETLASGGYAPIKVDAVVADGDAISIIFSFSRTYFMVDTPHLAGMTNLLQTMTPNKPYYELYMSIGFRRHAKTLFFRDMFNHINQSDDQFVLAGGIKGMVMVVFTLLSFDVVFKVIMDEFVPPKTVTREIVKEKYELVSTHDRAGRLADTQEFTHVYFPLSRMSNELRHELLERASSTVRIDGNFLVFEHFYVERRMQPLNLYIDTATDEEINNVMDDYGQAIKELAAANIFPGDMLLKNFGVTRHGRVIFYDYDEICHITDCRFRHIPEPQTLEQEMAETPWYPIADNDIFPEEFRLFFSGNRKAKVAFEKAHADLYQVDTWQQIQDRIHAGELSNVFPYHEKYRLQS